MATWIAADTAAAADAALRTADTTCTACDTGLTSPAGSDAAADCVKCDVNKALLTTTGACISFATTATGVKTGGRIYTTGADPAATVTLI